MAKLYGEGTITEIVKGKKYRIALSAGRDPLSGRTYISGETIPDNAFAVNDTGKKVKPAVIYGAATDDQKARYRYWKTPIRYLKEQETFLGTRRQAKLRIEKIRARLEMQQKLIDSGLNLDELASYGLSIEFITESGMDAAGVRDELRKRKEDATRSILFSDWVERYLSSRESLGKHRPATLRRDRCLSRHLIREFGSIAINEIKPAMVSDLYVTLRNSGLGDTSVKQCHRLLKTIMKQAVNNELINRNPVDLVDAPRNPKPERQALELSEARRLATICMDKEPTANKTAVYLGLALGVRIGEALGLEWGHIQLDCERPFVHVVQQFTEQGQTAPLKTDKDDNPAGRIIPIDETTVTMLKAWKATQRQQLNELGIEQGNDTPVITNKLGTYTNHSRFQRWWRQFCVDNGFGALVTEDGQRVVTLTIGDDATPYRNCIILWQDTQGWPCDERGKRYTRSYKRPCIKTRYEGLHFHSLRHTHFTMRIASGMDIPTAQALGGWTSPAMLMNVYAHPVAENIWSSAGFMDELQSERAAV